MAALALVGAAVAAEAVCVAYGVHGDGLVMAGLALVTLLLCAGPLVLDELRPPEQRHTILSLFVLCFAVSWVVPVFTHYLPGGTAVQAGNMGSPIPLKQIDTIRGQEVALLALICMLAAYALPVGRWIGRSAPSLRRDWSPVECQFVGLGMVLVGWTIISFAVLGLIPRTLGTGVISTLASFGAFATVVFTYAFLRYRSGTALLLLLATIVPSTALGFFSGSKERTLTPIVLVVLTGMLASGRIRLRWIVLGVVGFAVFYPTAIFYRSVILNDNRLPVTVPLSDPIGTLHRVQSFIESQKIGDALQAGFEATGNRLDGLGPSAVIVRDTPRISPFQHGRTLILAIYAFVPRLLWPKKPHINIGQWITDTYGSGPQIRSNTGPTVLGDLYLNFGLWSVAIGFLLMGIAVRSFHESTLGRARTAPAVLLSAVLAVKIPNGIMIGAVAGSIGVVTFALVPFAMIHLGVTTLFRRSRGSRTRPGVAAGEGARP